MSARRTLLLAGAAFVATAAFVWCLPDILRPIQRLKAADQAALFRASAPVWACPGGATPVRWMPESGR